MRYTENQKEAVKTAIARLEAKTSGELVPFIIAKSDDYTEVRYISALIFVICGMLIDLLLFFTGSPIEVWSSVFILFGAMIMGFFFPIILPEIIRAFTSPERRSKQAYAKAYEVFVKEEVFNTKNRIGILIYISMLEQEVIVLGDRGFNEKVKPNEWNSVVQTISRGIKKGEAIDSLVEAINQCEAILVKNGFEGTGKSSNELPDDLRIG